MRRRCARKALFRKLVEITLPIFFAILTEFEKIFPTKDSGRMHVVEHQADRVIADRMHFENLHRFLAADGAPLARRMALDLGARAAYAQIFSGEIKTLAAVEGDGERLAILVQPQFRRPGVCHRHLLFMATYSSWQRQSSVMWPPSMTFFHFKYSSLVKAEPSARLVPRGVKPNLANDVLSSPSCNALLMALLSLACTSGGVPAVP